MQPGEHAKIEANYYTQTPFPLLSLCQSKFRLNQETGQGMRGYEEVHK